MVHRHRSLTHAASSRLRRRPDRVAQAVRGALWCMAAGLVQVPGLAMAQASTQGAAEQRRFDIPAGPLDEALARFGSTAGAMIAVDADLTAGKRSAGLQGSYTVEQGLAALIAGSGMRAHAENGRYVLRASPALGAAMPMDGNGPATLAPVSVSASAIADPVTEKSGSYATRSTSTSTKLALSPRETPQSVTVVTRQRLDDMGVNKLSEVLAQTTGILVQETDSERITFSSRGYAINNFQVDGVLNTYGSIGGKNTDMIVYDRVEVIRGATGLTTGAGDPSGTVNLVRKRPTHEFAANGALLAGSWKLRRAEADVGGPLAFDGHLRGRLVVADESRESFRDFYEMKKKVAYGILEADLGDRTVLTAGYEYQKQTPTAPTWGTVLYWGWNPAAKQSYLVNMPRSTNLSSRWGTWAPEESTAFTTLEHELNDNWKIKGTYSHSRRKVDTDVYFGYGGTPRPDGSGVTIAAMNSRYDETMSVADVNATGKVELFGQRHDLTFGYTTNRRHNATEASNTADMPASWNVIPDWRNWNGNVAQPSATYLGYPSSTTTLRQSAAYGAARVKLAEPLAAVLGARYSSWRTESDNFNSNGSFRSHTGYSPDKAFTPYAGLLYDIDRRTTVYASYTDIFKPQNNRDKAGQYLDPIVGANYEIGAKSELLDGKLNLAAAVFRSTQDNVAEVDDTVPEGYLPGGETAYRSTGKGNKVRGWEVEASGMLSPVWNLSAGVSRSVTRNALGVPINTTTPSNLLRLFTTYKLPGALDRITVGGGLTWQSSIFRNGNRPVAERANGTLVYSPTRMTQSSVYLVNLMAQYRMTDNLALSLNVNNLFDKHYYRNVGFYSGVHWGEPRSVQVTLRGRF